MPLDIENKIRKPEFRSISDLTDLDGPSSLEIEDVEAPESTSDSLCQVAAAVVPPRELEIFIAHATGLRHLNLAGDGPWCRCEVERAAGSEQVGDGRNHQPPRCDTRALSKTLDPVWNEKHELGPWHVGESLLFTVYDQGLLSSKIEGRVQLCSADFYPNGFEGALPISGLEHAKLFVRVRAKDTSDEASPAKESRDAVAEAGSPMALSPPSLETAVAAVAEAEQAAAKASAATVPELRAIAAAAVRARPLQSPESPRPRARKMVGQSRAVATPSVASAGAVSTAPLITSSRPSAASTPPPRSITVPPPLSLQSAMIQSMISAPVVVSPSASRAATPATSIHGRMVQPPHMFTARNSSGSGMCKGVGPPSRAISPVRQAVVTSSAHGSATSSFRGCVSTGSPIKSPQGCVHPGSATKTQLVLPLASPLLSRMRLQGQQGSGPPGNAAAAQMQTCTRLAQGQSSRRAGLGPQLHHFQPSPRGIGASCSGSSCAGRSHRCLTQGSANAHLLRASENPSSPLPSPTATPSSVKAPAGATPGPLRYTSVAAASLTVPSASASSSAQPTRGIQAVRGPAARAQEVASSSCRSRVGEGGSTLLAAYGGVGSRGRALSPYSSTAAPAGVSLMGSIKSLHGVTAPRSPQLGPRTPIGSGTVSVGNGGGDVGSNSMLVSASVANGRAVPQHFATAVVANGRDSRADLLSASISSVQAMSLATPLSPGGSPAFPSPSRACVAVQLSPGPSQKNSSGTPVALACSGAGSPSGAAKRGFTFGHAGR
eukprot:TRINITY_DN10722_c0_g1_i3.p1 TRINITY_DN10722_c0_g1~~TRINITY_DN10722_c0_g1_i3.p1  ORF type:complete len:782 (-),score=117.47 TRINITY_DN10722_c0_g1_i3:304-2625(-)